MVRFEHTSDYFLELSNKCRFNETIAGWYERLADMHYDELYPMIENHYDCRVIYHSQDYARMEGYSNRARSLRSCMRFGWVSDYYRLHGVKVVQSVGRCRDRFCYNCQSLDALQRFHEYAPVVDRFSEKYEIFHCVFTQPNVPGFLLKQTIDLMQRSFSRLVGFLSGKKKIRGIDLVGLYGYEGAVRALEVSRNDNDSNYHPHFHCILVLKKGVDTTPRHRNSFSKDHSVGAALCGRDDLSRLFHLYGVRRMRRINYRHYICIGITLGFLACFVFFYLGSLGRLIEAFRDFGLSVAYYFCEIAGLKHGIVPTVNGYPRIPYFDLPEWIRPTMVSGIFLPETWAAFREGFFAYWRRWASMENFKGYFRYLGTGLSVIAKVLVFVLPFLLVLYLLLARYLKKQNNDYDKDSRPLRLWKVFSLRVCAPVRGWFMEMWAFIREHKAYGGTWLLIWALNFNAFTIALEFLAFYLYFVVSFDMTCLYRQVYKLMLDLSVSISAIPGWAWAILGLLLFDWFRKRIAYARLHHYEMRNRGFINARPIVYMVCGTMGKKKTTAITDMALSQEVMFRDKAFEKILENDLKFPYFPWINLENELRRAMEHHEAYNLATVRRLIAKKAARWRKSPSRARIFGYDYEHYGTAYYDHLKTADIWEVLETYAQLYFIYVIQSSLLISNYSVRVDEVLADLGNFPMWNSDFFRKDARLMESYSRHAHIIDFDALRLGKKVAEENVNADSFEFGVILITEIGKERGNTLELSEKKKGDAAANQKNDLFNSWLKMVRHSATVDNFPFVRVITDEQRPESWGADARDLCEIVHIVDGDDTALAMPFFSFEELLYSWLFGKFAGLYYRYRFVRSDNTLPMYALKVLTAKLHHYYMGIYNRFGYCRLRVQVENGTQDGELSENRYYLMSKKIYSKRFSTDCFSDFFMAKTLRSPVGIDDLKEYATEKATFDELGEQNSYFMNDLLNGLK